MIWNNLDMNEKSELMDLFIKYKGKLKKKSKRLA